MKIGLERINMQEGVIVEALLDSRATELVISSEFTKKQGFKFLKMENPIYVRNMDEIFNKERLIENTVEVNIYYQGHRKRIKIDVIRGQKWNIRMTRCLEEYVSRSLMVDFILFSLFIFLFHFLFFSFQNNSGQGLSVTLSHQSPIDGIVTRLITRLGRMEQKVLE